MRFLRRNTATVVTVGPFLDKTDAFTPEIALTATNEALTFIVDTDSGGTLVIDTTATGSGVGNNDLVHITNDNAGYYNLELTATQTDYVGRASLSIQYLTDHLPVFHEFMIVPANVYDSFFGSSFLLVDIEKINGAVVTGDGNATPWDGA